MCWKNLVFLDLNLLNQKCSLFSLAKAILKSSMGSQWGFFLILTTLTLTDLVQSQSIHVSMNPVPVGANVTISSDAEVTLGAWMFHGSLLVLIYPGGYMINKEKSDRIIFISNTSSLTLQSVRQEDSGLYKIEQINGFSFQIELSVQVPISGVGLSAKATDLVEFNSTAILMCSVSNGTSLSYEWLVGNSTISNGADVQLSDGNATISIAGLTRFDQGPYRCNVSNGLGYELSPPLNLNISYGPSNTTMTVTPMKNIYRSGSNITLSCSTDSKPTAKIQWMFNEMHLNQSGSQLDLQNVQESHSGTYKCIFHNPVTMRFSSNSSKIQVMDPLTGVTLNHSRGPAILDMMYSLQCEVTGPIGSIQWWKDGRPLVPDNRTVFEMDNSTLILNPVQHSDGGVYDCHVFNDVSNMTSSPFEVKVNYGPEMPTIMGPRVAPTEDSVTLTCWAKSVPPSSFKWFFNDYLVSNMSKYMTPALTVEMSGEYICMAFNSITGKNSTASTMLTVIDPIEKVTIDTSNSWALEGYSYEMICDVTGTVGHIYWMKNGEKLHPDNSIVFSMDNKTIMFKPLDRHDAGHYQCMAVNSFGNMTSTAYMLSVNFGPDRPVIYGSEFGEKGRDVVFNCSATSMPPSTYTWWFNGSFAANTSEFTAGPLFYNMSGKYTCMAHNQATGKNSTNSIMLTVIEAIESVMIQSNTTPINNENFTLTCHIVGPYDTIYWMKDDMKLDMNVSDTDSSMYTVDNMLHFTPLAIDNNGTYQCVATNRAAHHKSPPYTLLVNYGPLNVTISGPDTAKDGASVSLICSADSQPECDFHWFLDNQTTPYMNGSVINFTATRGHTGKYICIATNPVTNITMMQSKDFAIADHASAICIQGKGALLLLGLYPFLAHFLFL
ncbi:PREDICTED: carcinoembryonic antigen-related cell adhesion molecule 5-like isoform X3 [Cyprinodon variegatus]|uniref:carcinoembryonic antigen-related cell adhesion molecule 5-like isoform X3 n=1 Tax=Cyprinodon variegatus TaxID=28743 RepID=UPI0007428D6A|nr:PREDICTED: carcinoembryonic antigen-related cell adhesion molecule 5-like isoform X3 [Cyprinodon variegatus]